MTSLATIILLMQHYPTTFTIGLLKSTSREAMPTTNTIPHSSTSNHHQLPATSSTWAPTVLIIRCRLSRNMIKSGFSNRKRRSNNNNHRLKQGRFRIFRSKWARRDSRCSSQRLFVQIHICKQLRVPDRRMRWEALMAWIEARRLKGKCRRPISRACSTSQEQVCASSQRQGRGPPSATWQWTWLTKHSPARNPLRNYQGKQPPSRPKL